MLVRQHVANVPNINQIRRDQQGTNPSCNTQPCNCYRLHSGKVSFVGQVRHSREPRNYHFRRTLESYCLELLLLVDTNLKIFATGHEHCKSPSAITTKLCVHVMCTACMLGVAGHTTLKHAKSR